MRIAASIVLAASLVAGCSGGSNGGGGSEPGPSGTSTTKSSVPNPCELFTHEMATRASTKELKPEGRLDEGIGGDGRMCTYSAVSGGGLVMAGIGPSDGSATFYKESCTENGGTVVEGLGDWACDRTGVLSTGNAKFEVNLGGSFLKDDETVKALIKEYLAKVPQ